MSKEIQTETIQSAVVRFCGDSGDGMQLTGTQFTDTSAIAGNDITTFPDFPAEIRAPAGTTAGVSGFQVNFSSNTINTPGDAPDALVAMNPAALKKNIEDLKKGGILVLNTDSFGKNDLKKAGYESNPLEDNIALFENYQVHQVSMTSLTKTALEDLDMKPAHKRRCTNFFALGLMYWIYDRPLDYTLAWIEKKFAGKPLLIESNVLALKAGHNYGDTAEIFTSRFAVNSKEMTKGLYRQLTGNAALAMGLIAAASKAGLELVYGTYPITPASDILHELAVHKNFGVKTVQVEDEIAGIGVALGASYAGALGVTGTSGPGMCLKSEFMGLALMTELPLVIVDVQRGGPSTGLPTKTEQSDLLQAMYCRNGEGPIPIVAAKSPVDCFYAAYEAASIALKYMTPVILLSDGYIANGSELWRVPSIDELPEISYEHYQGEEGKTYLPYQRDEKTLARKWVVPGTPDLQNTLTGLEKDITGGICYDAENHDTMCRLREDKVNAVANSYDKMQLLGKDTGKVLVLSWGGTYGSVLSSVVELQKENDNVSFVHLRNVFPFPKDLGKLISGFDKVVIPELNLGQLHKLIRAEYAVDAISINKLEGKPFTIAELVQKIGKHL